MRNLLVKFSMLIGMGICLSFSPVSNKIVEEKSEEPKTGKPKAEAPVVSGNPYNASEGVFWVDSVFNGMSVEERIGQLFMVAAYSNKGEEHVEEISKLITDQSIGGLIFFQGGPVRQARLTNKYQTLSKTPLLLSIDAEWGLAMRLDSTVNYPRQMMLGAIQDDDLIYKMGADIAEQCKRLGIHVNLAPVIDVNNNPKNPVINSRSFGEDKYNVARKGVAYMRGMQDNYVLANAKHFPGHGDTDVDSHKGLPVIQHSKYRLENLELYPFKQLIKEGIGSMMVAHLFIPTLDSTENLASTLSKPIVTGLLKDELGFEGLIFTDALNMKGVSAFYKPGEVDVKALIAGNDVMLFSEDVPTAIKKFKKAIKKGEITQDEIDTRCKKILKAKYWVGLHKNKLVDETNLVADLNQPKYEAHKQKLIENALTLVKNDDQLVPFKNLDTLKLASLTIGGEGETVFQKSISRYAKTTHFQISKTASEKDRDYLVAQLDSFDVVIVGMHEMSQRPKKNFGVTAESVELLHELNQVTKVALTVFGNPYALGKMVGVEECASLMMAYHDNDMVQDVAAQSLFGGNKLSGKLPITATKIFGLGAGEETAEVSRIKFGLPETVGLRTDDLARIDEIVQEGLDEKAYPGCQVVVLKEGVVVYNKNFGHHTYMGKQPVQETDIYDLASITKVASTTMSLMYMQDQYDFSLDQYLCDYLPDLVDTTEYQNLNFRLMLAHHSGLVSWIPFYQETLIKGVPRYDVYSLAQSNLYDRRVANNLYINHDYENEIYKRIVSTALKNVGKYKYSDLGYYFFKRIIEQETEQPVNEFVEQTFYAPMGLTTMGFHPRRRFPLERIVPTEYDMTFRGQQIHGDVHDPGAAMMGGVGGHAGLFSNALDLAKLMQMLINDGQYGGSQFLSSDAITEFTNCQFCETDSIENRRGAGFDKPVRDGDGGPTCSCVSLKSFGHTGFTGTMAWADPEEDVVYVFLSNRVYPNADNRKLIRMGTRTKIMEAIYEAIENTRDTLVKQ